jgi:lipoate-protein ligase A
MILVDRTETDPYFNIAAEEYMLKNFREDVFMLWVNTPSIIVGKHQVATAEADIMYAFRNNIPVIRRLSGGGTVYHDEGNLNYSLIVTAEKGKMVDYEKYAATVIRTLARYDIEAELRNKSSLFTGEKKFSGNAEHIHRQRVLHHGTLLFSSDLEKLKNSIRPSHDGYDDRSIRSIQSQVTNLAELLPAGQGMHGFRQAIKEQFMQDHPGARTYRFTDDDRQAIRELAAKKYASDEWNFGYSPPYSLKKEIIFREKPVSLELRAARGRITNLVFMPDTDPLLSEASVRLPGCLHHPSPVSDILNRLNFAKNYQTKDLAELLAGMF